MLFRSGEREYDVMRRSALDLVAALPGARGAIARGLGHNWPVAAPDLAAATIRAWLTSSEPLNDPALGHLS